MSGESRVAPCAVSVTACPGGAIPRDRTVKVTLAGREIEWSDVDMEQCDICFRGGMPMAEGEEAEEYTTPMFGKRVKRGDHSPFFKKPRNLYNTGQAVCGARGCTRACMISLESRGVLENKFQKPFRRRKPWTLDWSQTDGPTPAGDDGKMSD